jgi:hypothetical protein
MLAWIGSTAGAAPQLDRTVDSKPVGRLAIYYGYPSRVNDAGGDLSRATEAFSPYDVIVLGDGLEFSDSTAGRLAVGLGRDEHERTADIIARLRATVRSPEIFGYIALGNTQDLSLAEIDKRVALWSAMQVTGIFFDEAGQDFAVTRERLAAAVGFAHEHRLNVCVNAFDPGDVLAPASVPPDSSGQPDAAPRDTPLIAGDAVLLESFAVRLGIREPLEDVVRRARRAIAMSRAGGVRIFGVATGRPDGLFHLGEADYAWKIAQSVELDAFGWSEPGYGASSSELPWRLPTERADREHQRRR